MSKAKSRSQSPSLRGADDTNKDNNNANILSTLSSPIITSSLSLLNVGSQRNIDNEQKDNIKMFNDNKFNAKEYIKEARAIKQSLPKPTNVNVTINKTQTKIPKKDETKKVIIGTSATAPTVASSTGITKPAATTNLVANVTSTSANASVSDSESDSDLF